MERVVLHVGPAKTGTTTIQGLLARNQAALTAHGVCYPTLASDPGTEGHPALAWETIEQGGGHPVRLSESPLTWDMAIQQAQRERAHTLLISAEDFSVAHEAALRCLRQTLGAVEIKIIYALREPRRLISSIWQQAVKWGMGNGEEVMEFDEAIPSLVDRYQASLSLYLEEAPRILGRASVQLMVVPNAPGPELFRRFAAAASLDHISLDQDHDAPAANPSLAYGALRLLLRMNRLAPIAREPLDRSAIVAREFILKHLEELDSTGDRTPMSAASTRRLDELAHRWRDTAITHGCIGEPDDLTDALVVSGERSAELSAIAVLNATTLAMARHIRQTELYLEEVCGARDWWHEHARALNEQLKLSVGG